jgi:hypothetical protein
MTFVRVLFEDLAQDFVVVDWDQRGDGKSYPALDPTATLTPDQLGSDTIELTMPEHRELGVAHPAIASECVPQAARLAHRDHRVVAVMQQHDQRGADVRSWPTTAQPP